MAPTTRRPGPCKRLRGDGVRAQPAKTCQAVSSPRPPARERFYDTVEEMDPQPTSSKSLDEMQRWNCHFDAKNVYAFLERLEELQRAYQLTDRQILRGLLVLLIGDTQLWYRNCATAITSLGELQRSFRAFYLSPVELRHLDRQIYDHHHRGEDHRDPLLQHEAGSTTTHPSFRDQLPERFDSESRGSGGDPGAAH